MACGHPVDTCLFAEAGHDVTEDRLAEAFKHSWGRFDERWKANEQSTAEVMARDAVDQAGFVEVDPQTQRDVEEFQVDDSDSPAYEPDTLAKRETLELVRAYYRIKEPMVRKRVFELTKALANASDPK